MWLDRNYAQRPENWIKIKREENHIAWSVLNDFKIINVTSQIYFE